MQYLRRVVCLRWPGDLLLSRHRRSAPPLEKTITTPDARTALSGIAAPPRRGRETGGHSPLGRTVGNYREKAVRPGGGSRVLSETFPGVNGSQRASQLRTDFLGRSAAFTV